MYVYKNKIKENFLVMPFTERKITFQIMAQLQCFIAQNRLLQIYTNKN